MRRLVQLVLTLSAAGGIAQGLTLDEVLFRANEAVAEYERRLSRAVTEERYSQRLVNPDGTLDRERTLVFDLVLVREADEETWQGFRDLLEVDGKPVRERDGRLAALLSSSEPDALHEARSITSSSGKQYLRQIWQGANLPTVGLTFLHALNQHRFNFERAADDTVAGVATWKVQFTEHTRPTIVRIDRLSLFARGTLWVEPSSGSLVKSEILLGDQNTAIRSTINVTFRHDEALGLWVPAELTETHDFQRRAGGERVEARATYGPFRQLGRPAIEQ